MAEVWKGSALFPLTETTPERLAAIAQVTGPFPEVLVNNAGPAFRRYFKEESTGYSVMFSRVNGRDAVRKMKIQRLPALSVSLMLCLIIEFLTASTRNSSKIGNSWICVWGICKPTRLGASILRCWEGA